MMGRGILVMLIAIVVATIAPTAAAAGAVVYAAAYTTELALSLTVYFQGEGRTPPATPDRGRQQ